MCFYLLSFDFYEVVQVLFILSCEGVVVTLYNFHPDQTVIVDVTVAKLCVLIAASNTLFRGLMDWVIYKGSS